MIILDINNLKYSCRVDGFVKHYSLPRSKLSTILCCEAQQSLDTDLTSVRSWWANHNGQIITFRKFYCNGWEEFHLNDL